MVQEGILEVYLCVCVCVFIVLFWVYVTALMLWHMTEKHHEKGNPPVLYPKDR